MALSLADKHPELANCIITALLWSIGDVVAQLFERHFARKQTHIPLPQTPAGGPVSYAPSVWSFNTVRTLRLASYAGLLFAPVTKAWFETLVEIFPGEGFAVAVKRMCLDQLLYSSCVLISLFTWIGLLESGFNVSHTLNKIRSNYWPSLKANWMLWPFVQIINMGFVPLEYRMIVAAIVNIPWTAYLAWRSGKTAPPTNDVELQTKS